MSQSELLPIQRLSEKAVVPTRAHPTDAGLDLYATEDLVLERLDWSFEEVGAEDVLDVDVESNIEKSAVVTFVDIAIALPPNSVGLILPRSSMNKRGILTFTGVVDQNYRGNIGVALANVAGEDIEEIHEGDKIAQLVILPVLTPTPTEVGTLEATDRGNKGFGSSGR